MNEFLIHEEDGIVDINLINDESVIKLTPLKLVQLKVHKFKLPLI